MWVVADICVTIACVGAIGLHGRSAIITTEGDVEHKTHALEVLGTAELGAKREEGRGHTPSLRPRLFGQKVRGLLTPLKEPGADVPVLRVPLRHPGAAPCLVQVSAPGAGRLLLPAALVLELPFGLDKAVLGFLSPLAVHPVPLEVEVLVHLCLVAVVSRMQCGRGERLVVDGFQDVVLPPSGPCMLRILPVHPERRPRAAGNGRMVNIKDEQAVLKPFVRLYSHALAALRTAQHLRSLCANEDAVKGCGHHASPIRLLEGHEFDHTVCGIRPVEEGPVREELLAYHGVRECIAARCAQARCANHGNQQCSTKHHPQKQ
mmetsp:Transcript_25405/g.60516  ORF Transcript_25405/g.60516 Transcript_25405/m.60516 type:complete len:319 (+) Transcript_25405:989-1945(+)|eukprot:CAMPEP_0181535058 /NCGR_PEP_ID=MMETSP1110-20121109/74061_1 /TAXON_ID=174948 /ORGANISM="Symbiodinium sp., Strain CCMP421" /LENGTH=318 /DNA_ID=CAMNT_0023666429 /DNA_START=773 /DNA_END=1729 /DNA_ORIENTATION=-